VINSIILLTKIAGKKIIELYNSGDFETEIKSDNSPLTNADLASNKIIMDGLKRISDYPIVSEEAMIEYDIRKKWNMFWLVDPLDGTKDFIAKNGQFTINIALIDGNIPVLGIVHIPAQNSTYWAEKGRGAYKDGLKIYNSSTRTDLIASDSIFHSSAETLDFLAKHHIRQIKRFGSSIKLCKLAEGEIDLYPRFNGTKEWDTAAGQAILGEAGCMIIDVTTGKNIAYNKPDIRNNYFVAMRNDLGLKYGYAVS
jgi:3'(2'), 5'-bisphosphate nucleotidase